TPTTILPQPAAGIPTECRSYWRTALSDLPRTTLTWSPGETCIGLGKAARLATGKSLPSGTGKDWTIRTRESCGEVAVMTGCGIPERWALDFNIVSRGHGTR